MKYVAGTGHIAEMLTILEIEEKFFYQELTNKITEVIKKLTELRKEKSVSPKSELWDITRESETEEIGTKTSFLWHELRKLEKERVNLSEHYKQMRQQVMDEDTDY